MQIKQVNKDILELSSSKAKLFFAYEGADLSKVKLDDSSFLIGFAESEDAIFRPGEFEYSDIAIYGTETKSSHTGTADMFAVTIDEVTLVFMDKNFGGLKKEQLDMVGRINVLVTNIEQRDDAKSIISKLDPAMVLAINYESAESASKATDLSPSEPDKKFKFTASDFPEEETITALLLLDGR